ncbi:MAG: hypothetical protein AB7D50_01420 [Bacilli bacterium]
MKKTTKITNVILGTLMVGFFALGFSSLSQNRDIEADATVVETKRVWMKNSITSTWDADGAGTAIHYWGGAQGTTFPGVRVKWDAANSLVYFDLPADVTTYMFVRVSGTDPITDWGAKTDDLVYTNSVGKYFDLTGPIAWDGAKTPGSFVSFTPATTTIVNDFAGTIDTQAEACSSEHANAAVDAYNNLSTFEQNQFDVLDVGGGVTGLQRLNFLKDFYNIETSLNVSPFGFQDSSKYSWLVIGIGTLGVFALLSYFFVTKKKHFN